MLEQIKTALTLKLKKIKMKKINWLKILVGICLLVIAVIMLRSWVDRKAEVIRSVPNIIKPPETKYIPAVGTPCPIDKIAPNGDCLDVK